MTRLVTAAVAVPALLLVLLRGPAWLFLALALAAALAAYWELTKIVRGAVSVGYVATALLVSSFFFVELPFELASLVSLLLIGVGTVMSRRPTRENLIGILGTVFASFYIGALVGSLVGLHAIEGDGPRWVVFLMTVVFVGDAGAYYVGRAVGKRPLAPRLSPKKTIEGLAGDVGAAVAAAVALNALWFPGVHVAVAAGLGVILSLFGVIGDLFESFLKRSADVKDTSSLIPGHGGVLDRVDSILFAAPALLILVRWIG